jgi:hypothetical protein
LSASLGYLSEGPLGPVAIPAGAASYLNTVSKPTILRFPI